jgi:hypothetical protein
MPFHYIEETKCLLYDSQHEYMAYTVPGILHSIPPSTCSDIYITDVLNKVRLHVGTSHNMQLTKSTLLLDVILSKEN